MKIIDLVNVETYNNLYGIETLHPLVGVVNLNNATKYVGNILLRYGIYALFLKQEKVCHIKYGRKCYDYQEGTIVCFAPGQVVGYESISDELSPDIYGIVFHPDFIRGTSLGKHIKDYTFFSYAVNEALHLSDEEKNIIKDCLDKIKIELEHGIDKHSKTLIAMNIELLLNYCVRFYERQFVTRKSENKDALTQFETLLEEYLRSNRPIKEGLPTVKYFADDMHLSPNYFGDMVKKEKGKTQQEHIQEKVIALSKEYLIETDKTMSEIAYSLGFQRPQHFNRFFKRMEGCTPTEYKREYGLA